MTSWSVQDTMLAANASIDIAAIMYLFMYYGQS